jgi:beta-lactam-binding protein with PASTA domain
VAACGGGEAVDAIRYGDLNIENGSHGVLISRLPQRQAAVDAFPRRLPATPPVPPVPLPGREQQVADALRAIEQGRPLEFHAGCGYGKTTLLQHIAVSAAARHPEFSCVYLRADGDRVEDLLQQLVTRLYQPARPVKLTPAECAHLLGREGFVVTVDDAPSNPAQVGYLLDVLPGGRFVLGANTRVLVRGGGSHELPGLPASAALSLLAAGLGRALTREELPAARKLAAAVDGQPLHLKQAAALARTGGHSLAALAAQAADDPGTLDRLSISSLTARERRALAVLAFAAGALVPGELVDVIGQAAQLADCLTALHGKGLAEQRHDRFGLPACKAESYRAQLLGDFQAGAAAGALVRYLEIRHPSAGESQSAADAVLAILEFTAERREWDTALQLARVAEQIVFIAGRWEAWHHVLSQGLTAANATGAGGLQAYFSHQLGSLELCLDRLDDAARVLQQALALREQANDLDGAAATRQNLELLGFAPLPPPPPPGPLPPRPPRRIPVMVALTAVLSALGLIIAAVAFAGVLHHAPAPAPSPSPGAVSTLADQVTVPEVTGQSGDQALSVLHSAGLAGTTTATGGCGEGDSGKVLSQSVAAGSRVSRGTSVGLSVCDPSSPSIPPPATVAVPDVVGQAHPDAIAALQGDGLTATAATITHCPAASNGKVIRQSVAAGSRVDTGTSVGLSVCSAPSPPPPPPPPPPPKVTVPNLTGQSEPDAKNTLQSDGLTATAATTTDCPADDNGLVVSQDVSAGSMVDKGTNVSFSVCAASPPPPVKMVPDVVGQTQQAASGTLAQDGFTAVPSQIGKCGSIPQGSVVSQDPGGGAAASPDNKVSIVVCEPDVVVK